MTLKDPLGIEPEQHETESAEFMWHKAPTYWKHQILLKTIVNFNSKNFKKNNNPNQQKSNQKHALNNIAQQTTNKMAKDESPETFSIYA